MYLSTSPHRTRRMLTRQRVRVVTIPSSSDPDVSYIVVVNPSGIVTCNCPAGWNQRPCRHAMAVAS